MMGLGNRWRLPLAVGITILMAGCGLTDGGYSLAPGATPMGSQLSPDDAAAGLSAMDASNLDALNNSGVLDSLDADDIQALEDSLGGAGVALQPAGYHTSGIFDIFTDKTKVGVLRSVEDGQFLLQTHSGWFPWTRRQVSMPLSADPQGLINLNNHLNQKVLVHGPLVPNSTDDIQVQVLIPLPSLAFITDFLTKGRVAGQIYDQTTDQPLPGAHIALVAEGNQYIYRQISRKDGKYYFSGLAPGHYHLSVQLAGYAPDEVAVQVEERHKTVETVGLTNGLAGGETGNPLPAQAP